MTYILLYFIILFLNISYVVTKKKIMLKLLFIILVLFSGLRYEVGKDFTSYEMVFTLIEKNIISYEITKLEKGYLILLEVVNFFNGTQQLVFLIMAIISNYFIYKFILETSDDIFMSISIFFLVGIYYASGFNGIRQYLAISIFLFSIKYIEEKNILKYFIFILIASLFHKSCFILIGLYFILRRNYSFMIQIMILIIGLILNNNINKILNLMGYGVYNNAEYRANISFILLMLFGLLAAILYVLNKKRKMLSPVYENINYLTIVGIILIIINENRNPKINLIFIRMVGYFFFIYIYMIPKLLNNLVKKKERIILKMLFFICISGLYFKTFLFELPRYSYNIEFFR